MPTLSATVRRVVPLFVLTLAGARDLSAQSAKSQFIIRKGRDTVAMEVFSRDGATLTSEIFQTNGPRTQYTIDLKPDSSIQHVELTRVNRANQTVGVSMFFLADKVKAQFSAQGQSQEMELPATRAVPFLAVSFALCEQLIQATHLAVGKSVTLTALRLGALDSATVTINRFHADSASFVMPDVQLKVALSGKGEVIGGSHVGQGWLVERKALR